MRSVIPARPRRTTRVIKKKTKPKVKEVKAKGRRKTKQKRIAKPIAKKWNKQKTEAGAVLDDVDILRNMFLKSQRAHREANRKLQIKKKPKKEETINVNLPKSIFTECFMKEEACNVKFNWENSASPSPSLIEEDMKYVEDNMNIIMDGAFENEMNLHDTHNRILIPACVVNETVNLNEKDALDILIEQATFVTDGLFDFKFDCEL